MLWFYVPFNSISVNFRQWNGEPERLWAMKHRLGAERISSPAAFEPATPWSVVGIANRLATQTLLKQLENCKHFFLKINESSSKA